MRFSARKAVETAPSPLAGIIPEPVDEPEPRGPRRGEIAPLHRQAHELAEVKIDEAREVDDPPEAPAVFPYEQQLVAEVEVDVERTVPLRRPVRLVQDNRPRIIP